MHTKFGKFLFSLLACYSDSHDGGAFVHLNHLQALLLILNSLQTPIINLCLEVVIVARCIAQSRHNCVTEEHEVFSLLLISS